MSGASPLSGIFSALALIEEKYFYPKKDSSFLCDPEECFLLFQM